VRGYKESGVDKTPSTPTSAAIKGSNVPPALQLDECQQRLLKRRSAPPSTSPTITDLEDQAAAAILSLSDEDMQAEAVRRRDEKEIQNDYNDRDGENQGRDIEHLILVTHGIGQRLGMRSVPNSFTDLKNISDDYFQNRERQLYCKYSIFLSSILHLIFPTYWFHSQASLGSRLLMRRYFSS
jgi:hypothetical protein